MDHPESAAVPNAVPALEELVETLKQLIAEHPSVDLTTEAINDRTPLMEDGLDLDSVVLVELINTMEERLGFQFRDTDLRMHTFSDLATLAPLVLERIRESKPGPE